MKFLPNTKDLINVGVAGGIAGVMRLVDEKITDSVGDKLSALGDFAPFVLPIVYILLGLFLYGKFSGMGKWAGFGVAIYGVIDIVSQLIVKAKS